MHTGQTPNDSWVWDRSHNDRATDGHCATQPRLTRQDLTEHDMYVWNIKSIKLLTTTYRGQTRGSAHRPRATQDCTSVAFSPFCHITATSARLHEKKKHIGEAETQTSNSKWQTEYRSVSLNVENIVVKTAAHTHTRANRNPDKHHYIASAVNFPTV